VVYSDWHGVTAFLRGRRDPHRLCTTGSRQCGARGRSAACAEVLAHHHAERAALAPSPHIRPPGPAPPPRPRS
jgi:hypothetical protein